MPPVKLAPSEVEAVARVLREDNIRRAYSAVLESKIDVEAQKLRQAVRGGKNTEAALAEGAIGAYETLLSELTRL